MSALRLFCSITFATALFIPTLAAEQINCESPQTFAVETETDNQIYVYGAEIVVEYDRNELAVYQYPATNAVNFLINDTVVSFAGHVVYDDQVLDNNALKTSKLLSTKIAGSAQLINNYYNGKSLSNCSTYLAKMPRENTGFARKLEIEILHRAASCLRSSICSKLGGIAPKDFQNADNHPFDFGPLSAIPRRIGEYFAGSRRPNDDSSQGNNLQSVINAIVDVVIAEIVEKIRERNEGTIAIPDISLDITEKSSWRPRGKLEAERGSFSDLTTLTRTKDAALSHDGLRFTASCAFGFSKATINYEKYKLKYGLSVSGHLSATIDGLSLAASIDVDLGRVPCRVALRELRVDQLGRVTISVSGLGPLNGLLSKLATWIAKKWRDEIVLTIENKMRQVVGEHLSKFSCEGLRP